MAIIKLDSGNYQAKLLSLDGKTWVSEVFPTKVQAQEQLARWKYEKKTGRLERKKGPTLDRFCEEWFRDVSSETPVEKRSGWRRTQLRLYEKYVRSHLGELQLTKITPQMVKRILVEMAEAGRAEQTQLHVFGLLRKMFGDAIENYQYITFNPAIRKLKPRVPQKEARHLNLVQLKALLFHVSEKKYGLGIWLQLYMGLRLGELQALRWEDVDLEARRIHIRRTYVRKLELFKDYPKGRKQHSHALAPELWEKLVATRNESKGKLVVTSPLGNILPYRWYLIALKAYCRELNIPMVGTHGLRHSTSELYMSHGASRDDLRQLFGHSSLAVTDRYVHGRGTNLEKVTNVIRLFG